jgi:hypothetical protein
MRDFFHVLGFDTMFSHSKDEWAALALMFAILFGAIILGGLLE